MRQGSATTTVASPPGNSAKVGRLPREGTILRHYYDLFVSNPGQVVSFNVLGVRNNVLRQLTDYYGLVIRKTSNKEERILVGRYLGAEYVEYVSGKEQTDKR